MNPQHPQWIRTSVVIVIIAGLFGAFSVISEGIGLTSGKIFALSFSLIFFGITAAIPMVITRKPECRALGMAGMAVSGVAFLLVALLILGEIGNEVLLKFTFSLFIASIALAHISLLYYFNLRNKYAHYARTSATVFITLFSFLLIVRIFEPFPGLNALAYNQSTLKMLVASLVLDLAATLLVPLCNRLQPDQQQGTGMNDEQLPIFTEKTESPAD